MPSRAGHALMTQLRNTVSEMTNSRIGCILRLLLAAVLVVLSMALIVAGLVGKQEDGRNGAKAGAGVVMVHGHQLQPRVGIGHVAKCPAAGQVCA